MTHIAALNYKPQEGSSEHQSIICISDSMGTYETGSKNDRIQKVVVLNGKYMIMGTGLSNPFMRTIHDLGSRNYKSVDELAQSAAEAAEPYVTPLGESSGLNLVISGQEDEGLGIRRVVTKDIIHPVKKILIAKKGIEKRPHVFDGSGAGYVDNYIENLQKGGVPLLWADFADALVQVYDFAKTSAEDNGVNTNFQIGVVTPEGTFVLYHPDVELTYPADYGSYLEQCSGLENLTINDRGKKEHIPTFTTRNRLKRNLRDVYFALTNALEDHLSDVKTVRSFHEAKLKGFADTEVYGHFVENLKTSKATLSNGANALTSLNLQKMLEFVRSQNQDCDKRIADFLDHASEDVPF